MDVLVFSLPTSDIVKDVVHNHLKLFPTVSGTSEMCAVKDIIFMAGGSKDAFAKCEGLFAAMGREWMRMGVNGAVAVTIMNRSVTGRAANDCSALLG